MPRLELSSEETSPGSTSLSAAAQQVSRMLRDQEDLDIPVHLEHLPMNVAVKALLNDVDRVRASANYISSITAKAAAIQKPAHVVERKRSSVTLPAMNIEPALSTPDSRSGSNSSRDSARSDIDVQDVAGGDLEEGYDSRQDTPVQGKSLNEYSVYCDKRDTGVQCIRGRYGYFGIFLIQVAQPGVQRNCKGLYLSINLT